MSMKMKTFVGKASIEGLQQMEDQVNNWLKRNKIEPVTVKQSFGTERHHGAGEERVLVISLWFHPPDDEL